MVKSLLRLSAGIDILNRKIGRGCIWLILASILISAGNAWTRKLFDASSNAWLEIQWYLFAAAFLGAAAYTLLVNEHVRIDAISQYFSERTRAWVDLLAFLLLVLPACLLLIFLGSEFFYQAWESGEMSYNAGGLVRWPVYLCIPVGFSLLALQVLSEAVKRLAFLTGHRSTALSSEADLPPLRFGGKTPGDAA
ncbi:MAG: TRAP transporter small permease subunit [Polaromonas sp.]|nr:TRAP transporter small permease subunit [Polaromonas sp.]MDP3357628.1 TRAP transporter small permease subunit [Polaromonas sp.]MDP3751543.1 TRAP transporter small permease subunit [Polaromonas sp.]